MTSPWSQQQREWLQALGHEVLTLSQGSMATADAPSEPQADAVIAAGTAGAARRDIPAQAAATSDAALLRALARAAGRQPQDNELQQVLPELATLRGNPAARRALWPQLRAMRKRGRG